MPAVAVQTLCPANQVQLENGKLTIRQSGRRGEPWAEVLAAEVANIEVFYELTQQCLGNPDESMPDEQDQFDFD